MQGLFQLLEAQKEESTERQCDSYQPQLYKASAIQEEEEVEAEEEAEEEEEEEEEDQQPIDSRQDSSQLNEQDSDSFQLQATQKEKSIEGHWDGNQPSCALNLLAHEPLHYVLEFSPLMGKGKKSIQSKCILS